MHIPDGIVTQPATIAAGWLGSAGAVGYAVRAVRRKLSEHRVVLMAVLAALVFALQMLNFPLPGGVSGHFAGGAALAILLGPWAAIVVMATVLLVQALVFTDGGLIAYGLNVFNMGVVGVLVGWAAYSSIRRLAGPRSRGVAAFAAGWLSVFVAAMAAAGEIVSSQRVSAAVVVGGIAFWHALIGVGEGAITAGLVGFLARVRPDLAEPERSAADEPLGPVPAIVALLAVAAAGLSFLASAYPDGLEHVLGAMGVRRPALAARGLLPGYSLPGLHQPVLAGVLAGFLGTALTGVALYVALAPRRAAAKHAAAEGVHRHAHRHDAAPEHAHPHAHAKSGHEHVHGAFFERYTYVISPVHALDPRLKVLAALALVAAIVASSPLTPLEFAATAALLIAVALLAKLPARHVLSRSAIVLPFAGMLALTMPLRHLGAPAERIAGLPLPAGSAAAVGVLATAWLSAFVVVLLSASTPVPKLFAGLERLRMPRVMLTLLSFMYRYSAVLGGQLASMQRSLDSRAPGLRGAARLRLYGHLAGAMFLRSYERGERVHAAMLSRGFTGIIPTSDPLRFRSRDLLAAILATAAVAALLLH